MFVTATYNNDVVSPSHSCHHTHFYGSGVNCLHSFFFISYRTTLLRFSWYAPVVRPPTINKLSSNISMQCSCLGSRILDKVLTVYGGTIKLDFMNTARCCISITTTSNRQVVIMQHTAVPCQLSRKSNRTLTPLH